jgi:transcriptional regulator with XRE-family HTH domain
MNTQRPWPARLTHGIATQIKRHRTEQKLSAQQLSDACTALGADIPRNTITDLEIGRRAHLSVAELLVLAAALNIPPLELVCPVGYETRTEILPGDVSDTFAAALWLAGEAPRPGPDDAEYLLSIRDDWQHAAGGALSLWRRYDRVVAEEAQALRLAAQYAAQAGTAATEAERQGYAAGAEGRRELAGRCRAEAEGIRRHAAALGLLPPGK